MTVRAVVQARMLSSRFRGKSLISVAGTPMLARVLERIEAMPFVNEVCVATTRAAADEPIAALAERRGVLCVRGEEEDVLQRYLEATRDLAETDCIVRFTADNPLYDPARAERLFELHAEKAWDYTCIDGLSHMVPEFIRVGALRDVATRTEETFDREHVTPFLRKHRDTYQVQTLPADFAGLRPDLDKHLTIDQQEDLERFEQMLEDLEEPGRVVALDDCYYWLDCRHRAFHYLNPGPGQIRASLAGHEVGDGCPTFVIAEIGQNHNGEMKIAKQLIEMAAACGADAVKFQKRDIAYDLTEEAHKRPYVNSNSFGATYGEHREYLELDAEQHLELREYALAHALLYFCTACDPPSVEVMEEIGNPVYKIASRDLTNIPLLRVIAETGKPVILSTGMAGVTEIREAVSALGDGPEAVLLMQCVSQYPAELERVNLRAMKTMRDEFGLLIGLSDHTPGIISSVAASIMGACMVEKHVTLSRAMKGSDHAGSLEENGLRMLVKYMREAALAMGDGRKEFDSVASAAQEKLERSLTSSTHIPAGTVLKEDMLTLRSPGNGIRWRDRVKILGRRARHDIAPYEMLGEVDFD
jgi:sialic acid synthase SpsE/spore coat polysaccharide biosynthesis protein SpsF (cytidylyltransferase family)